MKNSRPKRSPVLWASIGLGLSSEILILGMGGFLVGDWLGRRMGWGRGLGVLLLLAGIGLGFWHLWRVLKSLEATEEKAGADSSSKKE